MKNQYTKSVFYVFVMTIAWIFAGCSKTTEAPAADEPAILSIKSISPRQAKIGELVTIKGTGFGNEQSLVRIFFGRSEMVRPIQFSDTVMTAYVPPDATPGRISVSLLLGVSTTSNEVFNPIIDETIYNEFNKIQYTGSGSLSADKSSLSAGTAGNKIMIAGGFTAETALNNDVDIYDVSSNIWQAARLSLPRRELSVAGTLNKILVAGGIDVSGKAVKTVDIYDVGTNTWTTSQLSVARSNMAAIGNGPEIFFAGGLDENLKESDVVDIYNVETGLWRTHKLSVARVNFVAAAIAGKVLFAGGNSPSNPALDGRAVDVYDSDVPDVRFRWSTATLAAPRYTTAGLAAAGNNRYILFAGGASTAQDPFIEKYDATTNTWGKFPLNEEIRVSAAAAAGTKIVFYLGKGRSYFYDVFTNSGVAVTHAGQTTPTVAAGLKNKIVFAGGATYDQFTVFK